MLAHVMSTLAFCEGITFLALQDIDKPVQALTPDPKESNKVEN